MYTPSTVIDEFMRLFSVLSGSVSVLPLNVATSVCRPASPSKASRPVLVATVPLPGVKNGAMLVENVCVASTVPRPS